MKYRQNTNESSTSINSSMEMKGRKAGRKDEWSRGKDSKATPSIPKSPLEEDSVKLGVPSVQVGVLPSTESGGVQVRVRTMGVGPTLESTLSVDRESVLGSSCTSLTLRTQHHHLLVHHAPPQTYTHTHTYTHHITYPRLPQFFCHIQ